MLDGNREPIEAHNESARTRKAVSSRSADRDEVYDASLDSFPASDPPSWMGMRVGGPSAGPSASSRDQGSALGERPPPADLADAHIEGLSLASQWTDVHVCHVEAHDDIAAGRTDRTVLRAVVQLGALAPADVRVTVRQPAAGVEAASEGPVRLWSAQSYRNGTFVFEASTNASALADGADLLVSVEPSPARHGAGALDAVVTQFTKGGFDDGTSCLRAKPVSSASGRPARPFLER